MGQKPKKLCWNCEGNVSRGESNCPYCGVYLHPGDDHWEEEEELQIDPPYQPEEEKKKEEAVVSFSKQPKERRISLSTANSIRHVLLPLSVLLMGSLFLFFGVFLFFFSHHGVLTLQWNATYWHIYLLLALPLVWGGIRYLDPAEDPSLSEETDSAAFPAE